MQNLDTPSASKAFKNSTVATSKIHCFGKSTGNNAESAKARALVSVCGFDSTKLAVSCNIRQDNKPCTILLPKLLRRSSGHRMILTFEQCHRACPRAFLPPRRGVWRVLFCRPRALQNLAGCAFYISVENKWCTVTKPQRPPQYL